jgi:4-aminobutyrate aminotransferase-like enzyme
MCALSTPQVLEWLSEYESPNVTYVSPADAWPIVWERAEGVHVWDPEGKKYLDLTAGFGVAAAGHANRQVVAAATNQLKRLAHAMGDVHPHAGKALLAKELSHLTYGRWTEGAEHGKVLFANSGFEAVEGALKTAHLATRQAGVICFEGAYHGLGYGALNTTHREMFRSPFRNQLREFGSFVPFPCSRADLPGLRALLVRTIREKQPGAILVEPIQGRGGIRVPPQGFLPLLRRLADDHGLLLILDEVYTGFGRTGAWFACEHTRTIPDLICLGKALTGGFPLSACVGRSKLMDAAWPKSKGEAIHTSTFLGHPVGCAMALAQIREIRRRGLVNKSLESGAELQQRFLELRAPMGIRKCVRGLGLMVGIEFQHRDGSPATELVLHLVTRLLHSGFILLPEGEHANVLGFTPPLNITVRQLKNVVKALQAELDQIPNHG